MTTACLSEVGEAALQGTGQNVCAAGYRVVGAIPMRCRVWSRLLSCGCCSLSRDGWCSSVRVLAYENNWRSLGRATWAVCLRLHSLSELAAQETGWLWVCCRCHPVLVSRKRPACAPLTGPLTSNYLCGYVHKDGFI
jgi:hypothetical protein